MSLHNYSKIPQVSFHFLNLMALRQLSATASRITGKLRDEKVVNNENLPILGHSTFFPLMTFYTLVTKIEF